MLKLCFGLLLAGAACASTLPCASATLQTYDASAFACTEGGITFSDFTLQVSGSETLAASAIDVAPLTDGLEFAAGFSAPAGMTLDIAIGYTETISGGSFTSDSLAISGFGASGGGSVDVSETVCVGAAFSAAGVCPATTATLNVFDGSSGLQQNASAALSGSTLGVVKDIAIIGTANLSLIDNATPTLLQAQTPEPGTLVLFGLGLCAMGLRRRFR